MKTFYTSDTHFNHANIIEYSGRPFRWADGQLDLNGMNRSMIAAWNSVVGPEDLVVHLGDFAMGHKSRWPEFRRALNGRILLIKGNHDRKLHEWMLPGDFALEHMLTQDGYFLVHNPDHLDIPHEAKAVICGHVHEAWKTCIKNNRVCYNVGVDVRGYKPLTLEEIIQ